MRLSHKREKWKMNTKNLYNSKSGTSSPEAAEYSSLRVFKLK